MCLLWGHGLLPGGCLPPGGVSAPGGIPACTEADTPPVDRITDTSKNITLATTLLLAGNNLISTRICIAFEQLVKKYTQLESSGTNTDVKSLCSSNY